MRTLKILVETVSRFIGHVLRLPQTVADGLKNRRRQLVLDEAEAERIDRIRHPSKYLGK